MIQTLARELFAVADENGGHLPSRVVFYCDEFGTMPAFDVEALFSAVAPVVSHWYPSSNRWRSWRRITAEKAQKY